MRRRGGTGQQPFLMRMHVCPSSTILQGHSMPQLARNEAAASHEFRAHAYFRNGGDAIRQRDSENRIRVSGGDSAAGARWPAEGQRTAPTGSGTGKASNGSPTDPRRIPDGWGKGKRIRGYEPVMEDDGCRGRRRWQVRHDQPKQTGQGERGMACNLRCISVVVANGNEAFCSPKWVVRLLLALPPISVFPIRPRARRPQRRPHLQGRR